MKKISNVIVRGKRGSESLAALKEKLDHYDNRIYYEVEYVEHLQRCQVTVFYNNGETKTLNGQPRMQELHELFNPDYL